MRLDMTSSSKLLVRQTAGETKVQRPAGLRTALAGRRVAAAANVDADLAIGLQSVAARGTGSRSFARASRFATDGHWPPRAVRTSRSLSVLAMATMPADWPAWAQ